MYSVRLENGTGGAVVDRQKGSPALLLLMGMSSLPAAAVVAVFQFTWVWNDLLFGLILTCSADTRPIMVGLAQLQGARAAANMPGLMAGAVIASIPTIALFTALRRYFIQGLALQTAGE